MTDGLDLRPLTRTDFPRLARWLEEPLVKRWWNHESDDVALERDFGPSLDGEDVAEYFVASHSGGPFGLIQRYPWGPYPEYLQKIQPIYPVAAESLSIDYLIGEPTRRGHGLGTAMITALVHASWATSPDAPQIVVPVACGNRSSWRALERSGFTRVATGTLEPDNPIDPPDHVIYALDRPNRRFSDVESTSRHW